MAWNNEMYLQRIGRTIVKKNISTWILQRLILATGKANLPVVMKNADYQDFQTASNQHNSDSRISTSIR